MDKIYLIYCSTGCSCCCDENHYRGPYKSKEDAEKRISYFYSKDSKFWPLASQYARCGRYSIEEHSYEKLPDGRVIINEERVYKDFTFIPLNEDGSLDNNDLEFINFD